MERHIWPFLAGISPLMWQVQNYFDRPWINTEMEAQLPMSCPGPHGGQRIVICAVPSRDYNQVPTGIM
eukprot:4155590-Karenia_brevis.AAC.1